MAKFVQSDPAQADIWSLIPNFDLSTLVVNSTSKITVEFDPANNPSNNAGHAFKMVAIGKGIVTNNGQIVGGTITKLKIFDSLGNQIGVVTDISFSASLLGSYFIEDLTLEFDKFLHSGNGTYIGGSKKDDMQTGAGNDVVNSRDGNDYIKDGGGKDMYNGGGRLGDTLTYDEWYWNPSMLDRGIVADLEKGTIKGPDGKVDTVKNIENIHGTYLKDTIKGDSEDNRFMGYAGRDFFDGRGGVDVIEYHKEVRQGGELGVKVFLNKGYAKDGFGQKDKFTSIEGVGGTQFDDNIVGSNKDNLLWGREGNDVISGRGGDDEIRGDDGRDILKGGSGDDVFIFVNKSNSTVGNADVIKDFSATDDEIAFVQSMGLNTFINTNAFSSTAGEVRAVVSGSDTIITGDVDGDGNADFEIVLQNYNAGLNSGDFDFSWL